MVPRPYETLARGKVEAGFTEGFSAFQTATYPLEADASAADTQLWLLAHRFNNIASTFANFTATDILRLSRAEVIEICGLVDGIRLFNTLHAKYVVLPGRYARVEDSPAARSMGFGGPKANISHTDTVSAFIRRVQDLPSLISFSNSLLLCCSKVLSIIF